MVPQSETKASAGFKRGVKKNPVYFPPFGFAVFGLSFFVIHSGSALAATKETMSSVLKSDEFRNAVYQIIDSRPQANVIQYQVDGLLNQQVPFGSTVDPALVLLFGCLLIGILVSIPFWLMYTELNRKVDSNTTTLNNLSNEVLASSSKIEELKLKLNGLSIFFTETIRDLTFIKLTLNNLFLSDSQLTRLKLLMEDLPYLKENLQAINASLKGLQDATMIEIASLHIAVDNLATRESFSELNKQTEKLLLANNLVEDKVNKALEFQRVSEKQVNELKTIVLKTNQVITDFNQRLDENSENMSKLESVCTQTKDNLENYMNKSVMKTDLSQLALPIFQMKDRIDILSEVTNDVQTLVQELLLTNNLLHDPNKTAAVNEAESIEELSEEIDLLKNNNSPLLATIYDQVPNENSAIFEATGYDFYQNSLKNEYFFDLPADIAGTTITNRLDTYQKQREAQIALNKEPTKISILKNPNFSQLEMDMCFIQLLELSLNMRAYFLNELVESPFGIKKQLEFHAIETNGGSAPQLKLTLSSTIPSEPFKNLLETFDLIDLVATVFDFLARKTILFAIFASVIEPFRGTRTQAIVKQKGTSAKKEKKENLAYKNLGVLFIFMWLKEFNYMVLNVFTLLLTNPNFTLTKGEFKSAFLYYQKVYKHAFVQKSPINIGISEPTKSFYSKYALIPLIIFLLRTFQPDYWYSLVDMTQPDSFFKKNRRLVQAIYQKTCSCGEFTYVNKLMETLTPDFWRELEILELLPPLKGRAEGPYQSGF